MNGEVDGQRGCGQADRPAGSGAQPCTEGAGTLADTKRKQWIAPAECGWGGRELEGRALVLMGGGCFRRREETVWRSPEEAREDSGGGECRGADVPWAPARLEITKSECPLLGLCCCVGPGQGCFHGEPGHPGRWGRCFHRTDRWERWSEGSP